MLKVQLDYEPHYYQSLVHQACETTEPYLFVVVAAGRQSGKTKLCIAEAIKYALENDNSIIWWVSPTDGQANKVLKETAKILKKTELYKSHKYQRANAEIVLINDSVIQFRSAASESNLRGSTVHFLIIDEAAFIKKETIEGVILPMVSTTANKILIASTPKGKNWFYEYWLKGQRENETEFKSYRFTSEDNPRVNKRFIETARREMNQNLFKQEFLAEWIDSASVFPNIHQCIFNASPELEYGMRYFMGIDIGFINDYSCISVFSANGKMIFIDRFKGVTNKEVKDRIKAAYHKYRPVKALIEANNQGLPIYSDLKFEDRLSNLEAFNTTGKSKEEIINNLIAAFNEKRISILNEDWLIKEFEAFVYKITDVGKLKFEASSGFNDDGVMSTAICWSALGEFKHSGKYVIRTSGRRAA